MGKTKTQPPGELLAEAQAAAYTELAELRAHRAATLKGMVTDPRAASRAIREVDSEIKDLEAHLEALATMIEQNEVEQAEAIKKERTAEAAEDVAAVRRLMLERVTHAAQIDEATEALHAAITRYRDSARVCAALYQRAITTKYGDQIDQRFDAHATGYPLASGTGSNPGAVMVNTVRRLVAVLGSDFPHGYINMTDRVRSPATFREAASQDERILSGRL